MEIEDAVEGSKIAEGEDHEEEREELERAEKRDRQDIEERSREKPARDHHEEMPGDDDQTNLDIYGNLVPPPHALHHGFEREHLDRKDGLTLQRNEKKTQNPHYFFTCRTHVHRARHKSDEKKGSKENKRRRAVTREVWRFSYTSTDKGRLSSSLSLRAPNTERDKYLHI